MHNYLKFAIIDANNTADLQNETIRNIFVCGCKILQGKRQESEKEEYEEIVTIKPMFLVMGYK